MFTAFFPLLSRLRSDPDAAWSLWCFLNAFSDALWEMHQDDFLQRFSDELHDDPWPAPDDHVHDDHVPGDRAPDDNTLDEPVADDHALDDLLPDSTKHEPDDHSIARDLSLADLW